METIEKCELVAEANGVSLTENEAGTFTLSYQEQGRQHSLIFFSWYEATANFERHSTEAA